MTDLDDLIELEIWLIRGTGVALVLYVLWQFLPLVLDWGVAALSAVR